MEPIKEATDNSVSDDNKKESLQYPYRSFESTFSFVQKIYNDLGQDYHTREQIASVHNMAPNSIKQPLSTAQQFGLLEIKFGVGYRATELFSKILLPDNEQMEKAHILESIRSAPLYNEILGLYEKAGILPNQTGLTNTLIRNQQYDTVLAARIVKDFVSTLKNFGFLDDKNILKLSVRQSSQVAIEQASYDVPAASNPLPPENHDINISSGSLKVLIPLKGKEPAVLVIPKDFSDADVKRIVKFINALRDDEE